MRVGIQGIEGSFSEEAAKSYCKKFGIENFSYRKFKTIQYISTTKIQINSKLLSGKEKQKSQF